MRRDERIEKIPKKSLQQIMKRIAALAVDPRPPGCEKLTGQERYRIRQGTYRIIYAIRDDELTVWVVKIGQRKVREDLPPFGSETS
ncbi:MAG: type II toxin-antitoxin system RelE/ParE family toxin [Proteobacteria bacterium]|nr:type II toxin-antitoxin system RelE/ParE family toxin [Pseudomonadota bacterium]MBU4581979.1 type II toxin-antitoxin system RelE/ParE family toxin [Pseudomonadota bacterium]MCG2742267.1 type II toxin-antitoxin system RelE/ParE family toxin [Syntrophaceae bacterium]